MVPRRISWAEGVSLRSRQQLVCVVAGDVIGASVGRATIALWVVTRIVAPAGDGLESGVGAKKSRLKRERPYRPTKMTPLCKSAVSEEEWAKHVVQQQEGKRVVVASVKQLRERAVEAPALGYFTEPC
eukprot:8758347-Pyramimonas_sp.AAC.1